MYLLPITCLYVCTKESVCSTVYTVMGKHVHTTCMYYGMALTLLPRQCGGSGSAVAVGSSMLQDVASIPGQSRIAIPPSYILLCIVQESARKCRGEEVV